MLIVKRYTATWCQPCKALSPIMSELQSEVNGVQFITIDVDQDRETTSKDNVSSVPTVVMVKDGQEVHRFLGVKSKQTILELINQFS